MLSMFCESGIFYAAPEVHLATLSLHLVPWPRGLISLMAKPGAEAAPEAVATPSPGTASTDHSFVPSFITTTVPIAPILPDLRRNVDFKAEQSDIPAASCSSPESRSSLDASDLSLATFSSPD